MRRIQESVGYTGKYRSRSGRYDREEGEWKGAAQVALFLAMVGLIGPVIPKWGIYMWFGGWLVNIALFITSIVIMVKGSTWRGVLGLLFAIFVLPVWTIAAPIGVLMASEGHGFEQALQELAKQMEAVQIGGAPTSPDPDTAETSTGPRTAPFVAPPVMATPAPVVEEPVTITSKDGSRVIRGTIDAYHSWGVRLNREDGQVVNVQYELMSDADAQKFRERASGRAR